TAPSSAGRQEPTRLAAPVIPTEVPLMPDKDPMSQLYSRLGSLGFPPKYLHEVVLPEWWEDEVAHNPAGFAQGLLALSRNLGLDLSSLQNESVPVGLRNLGPCKFKKAGSKRDDDLQ